MGLLTVFSRFFERRRGRRMLHNNNNNSDNNNKVCLTRSVYTSNLKNRGLSIVFLKVFNGFLRVC